MITDFVKSNPNYYIKEFKKIGSKPTYSFSFNLFAFILGPVWFGMRNVWNWTLAFLIIETFSVVQIIRGLFGASGLVGSHVLNQLISNNSYSKIKLFVRSSIDISDPKIEIIQTDFNNLENHREDIKGDDCFFCIGTTKQNSPDKSEYRRVELEVPKQIAQIAKSNSVNSFVFISSGYADPKSSGDYLKFKGEVEEELKRLNFPKLGIMRPSFLLGDRKEKRVGEKIGIFVFKLLSPLFLGPLKKMKPIHSATVAKAMIKTANENLEKNIFESNEIAELVLN